MSVIAAGTTAPEFTLQTEDGVPFTNLDLEGKTVWADVPVGWPDT